MAAFPSARALPLCAFALLAETAWAGGCGGGTTTPITLEDPTACKTCHPTQYEQWSGSMHAYASEDPVFRAMNQRAQRENPATGTFCAQCHAPVAVREKLTTDGQNLDSLPFEKHGVTCYFCHATESVAGTHNNPLVLATDDSLYGPIGDPAPGTPHKGLYSALFDDTTNESVAMCGSCHDIQNLQGAHVERTYEEWTSTLFAVSGTGESCAQCHMPTNGQMGPASTVSTKIRSLHNHAMAAVDLAVTPFPSDNPQNDTQKLFAQSLLDDSLMLQETICVNQVTSRIEVTFDNTGAGHGFPSGATPDRRAWAEVTAYVGDQVIYSSGTDAALPLEDSPDPDLLLLRDCLFDGAQSPVKMFWQAASVKSPSSQFPGSPVQNVKDPKTFSLAHVKKLYPDASGTSTLPQIPDRVTVRVHVKAIGDDVLADLVTSGDLDPSLPDGIAHFDLTGSAALDWTLATATPHNDAVSGISLLCVSNARNFPTNTTLATSAAHCAP